MNMKLTLALIALQPGLIAFAAGDSKTTSLPNDSTHTQRSFFDERAEVWDSINHPDTDKIHELLDRLEIGRSDRILDVGTGTGVLIPELCERAPEGQILGVDISPNMIDVARRKWADRKQVAFSVCDVENSLPEGQYDKIILFCMFPHLEHKEQTVARLTSCLAPGGKLMIAHDRSRDFLNHLHGTADERVHEAMLRPADEQKALFEAEGLQVDVAYEDDSCYYIIIEK